MKKIPNKYVAAAIVILVMIIALVIIDRLQVQVDGLKKETINTNPKEKISCDNNQASTTDDSVITGCLNKKFPEMLLPIKYFDQNNVDSGSVADNSEYKYSEASFNEMTYQSYPTTTISLAEDTYSSENKTLTNKKSWEDIVKANSICGKQKNEDCGYLDVMKENFNEYKDLAPYYLPESSIWTKNFDVDEDNKNETIVFVCGVGANHCPDEINIIKNNKVIFSASSSEIDITPTDTSNGFYLEWKNNEDFSGGYCCPFGYVRTRFVYENKEFKPILEQKVNYLRIKDSN